MKNFGCVFEHRLLRKVLVLKRAKLKADWRKLHDQELHNLYSLQHIRVTLMITSRRITRTRFVARMAERGNA